MTLNLKNKTLFISDGRSMGGEILAEQFLQWGMNLILHSPADENFALLEHSFPGRVLATQGDLANEKVVTLIGEKIGNKFGPLHGLLLNQTWFRETSIESCGEDDFMDDITHTAQSTFMCLTILGESMKKERKGSILCLSNLQNEKPSGQFFTHAVSMGMIQNLCRESAVQLGRYRVRTNFISHSPLEGEEFSHESSFTTLYEGYDTKIPSRKRGSYKELAHLAGLLFSDECSFLNGAEIRFDGGVLYHFLDPKTNYLAHQKESCHE